MDLEKVKDLQRTMKEAGETKGQYAHVLPETCKEVADALGNVVEVKEDKGSKLMSLPELLFRSGFRPGETVVFEPQIQATLRYAMRTMKTAACGQ